MLKNILTNGLILLLVIMGFLGVTYFSKQELLNRDHHILSDFLHQASVIHSPKFKKGESLEEASLQVLENSYGKPLLVNFGASWCGSCQGEKKELNILAKKYHDKSLKMIGVVSHDKRDELKNSSYLNEKRYPVLFDEKGKIAESYNIVALPHTILFDGEGAIYYRLSESINPTNRRYLEKKIEDLLNHTDKKELENSKKEELPSKLEKFHRVPPFEMTSSSGSAFSSDALENKVWVANFIFTNCQSTCPILTAKMKEIQSSFSRSRDLKLVSFTVDPQRDTPHALRSYAEKKGANLSQWYFLTGQWSYIKNFLQTGIKIGVPDTPMFHSEKLILVDAQMNLRGYYSANSKVSLKKLHRDIGYLLREIGRPSA